MTYLCGGGNAPPCEPFDWPEGSDVVPCCIGSAMGGPADCTCWEVVYDLQQADRLVPGPRVTRDEMCADCAFRPGSPELSDDRRDGLLELAYGDNPFWCHHGIRRVIEWRHPDGRVVAADPGDYRPPVPNGRPYRADGTPAEICAGWDAHHHRATAELAREEVAMR